MGSEGAGGMAGMAFAIPIFVEDQNVRNFPYPVRIRWSRQPNLVPFYLYNRIFECPENIRNDGFPDVRWSSSNNGGCYLMRIQFIEKHAQI